MLHESHDWASCLHGLQTRIIVRENIIRSNGDGYMEKKNSEPSHASVVLPDAVTDHTINMYIITHIL